MAHYNLYIKGLVQGVGFRPFIFRLANQLKICGEVRNDNEGVYVHFNSDENTKNKFLERIMKEKPAPANILDINVFQDENHNNYDGFKIIRSITVSKNITAISPDIATCDDCIKEMQENPLRLDYPFTNCTNCGPRFSLIKSLPYDRESTSMKDFKLCRTCKSQYEEVSDRRFHAQPIACKKCGPYYTLFNKEKYKGTNNQSDSRKIKLIAEAVDNGKIVCLKGLGGYNLICDAFKTDAVNYIRNIKKRPYKPLAIMFRSIECAEEYMEINNYEKSVLTGWRRPIVLLQQKKVINIKLNDSLSQMGVILPYAPIHTLLFKYLKSDAIVFTSGNISSKPIIFNDDIAKREFLTKADLFLSNNREIINPMDDSVVKCIDEKTLIIRRSRGYVPEPLYCDFKTEGIFSVGAENNTYFAIGKDNNIIASQYLGNTSHIDNMDFMQYSMNNFSEIYKFKYKAICCDLHPHYNTSLFAERISNNNNIPLIKVQHHYAHALSVMLEHNIRERVLAVVFDGAGYGIDNKIWGSEFMICDTSNYIRLNHFDYVSLPGGDIVSKQPWRSAISFCDNYNLNIPNRFIDKIGENRCQMIKSMISNKLNTFHGCGAGRLFDAVSSLLNICDVNFYQGQAAMKLESMADIKNNEVYNIDMSQFASNAELLSSIIADLQNNMPKGIISSRFHNTLALKIAKEIILMLKLYDLPNKVVLSGGCFQNVIITTKIREYLEKYKIQVLVPEKYPMNDGGIAIGQTYYGALNI